MDLSNAVLPNFVRWMSDCAVTRSVQQTTAKVPHAGMQFGKIVRTKRRHQVNCIKGNQQAVGIFQDVRGIACRASATLLSDGKNQALAISVVKM